MHDYYEMINQSKWDSNLDCNQFLHHFQSSYEYLIHHQSDDYRGFVNNNIDPITCIEI